MIVASVFFFVSCGSVNVADLNPDDFSGNGGGVCDGVSTSFSTNVVPIFSSRCVSCHGGDNPQGGMNLAAGDVYGTLLDGRVNTSDVAMSSILRKPLGLDNHGGQTIFSSVSDPDYITIFCWIEAGAENDSE